MYVLSMYVFLCMVVFIFMYFVRNDKNKGDQSFIREIVFENVVCKMTAIWSRPQCVKSRCWLYLQYEFPLFWHMAAYPAEFRSVDPVYRVSSS